MTYGVFITKTGGFALNAKGKCDAKFQTSKRAFEFCTKLNESAKGLFYVGIVPEIKKEKSK